MKLQGNKKGTLLYEGIVGLFLLGGFSTIIFSSWHIWNEKINTERIELDHERTILNEFRQKL
jgi:hypothetical protein